MKRALLLIINGKNLVIAFDVLICGDKLKSDEVVEIDCRYIGISVSFE